MMRRMAPLVAILLLITACQPVPTVPQRVLQPDALEIHLALAHAYLDSGLISQAEQIALQISPNRSLDASLAGLWARLALARGETARAEQLMQHWADDDLAIAHQWGAYLVAEQRYRDALVPLARVRDGYAYAGRVDALWLMARAQEALLELEAADASYQAADPLADHTLDRVSSELFSSRTRSTRKSPSPAHDGG